MIYDCFLFYTELKLLELRLSILSPVVDKFVILESTRSFIGREKPLYFRENQARFAKYKDQIIHIIVEDDPPNCDSAWVREKHQRNSLLRGLTGCQSDDVVILSDVDEIPDPQLLQNLPELAKPIRCRQLYFFYQLNNLNITRPWWSGTRIVRYRHLETYSLQDLRKLPKSDCMTVYNAGWHFSFLGDVNFISQKISDFSHQEFNLPTINNTAQLESAIAGKRDILGRNYRFAHVRLDSFFPRALVDNSDQFKPLIGSYEQLNELPSARDYLGRRQLYRRWLRKLIQRFRR